MWKIRKGFILSAVLLSLWLSPLLSGSHAQAEAQYTISETELTQLEMNSQMQKVNSEKKDRLLIEQEKQLNEAEMKSAKAENELQIANEQIKKLKKSNEVTENSLKETRELFNEYAKEAERKVKIKARQRNMWIVISTVAVGAAISRR
nr:MAG TPA: recombination and DNA strand exchange inhibitor protein [Caudoviricetes sp.]